LDKLEQQLNSVECWHVFLHTAKGLIPRAMEDKWYIYFENDCLYFHRSWTGLEILCAEIIREDGESVKYIIKELYAEREGIKNGAEAKGTMLTWSIFGRMFFPE
jgi:hypothetical protein